MAQARLSEGFFTDGVETAAGSDTGTMERLAVETPNTTLPGQPLPPVKKPPLNRPPREVRQNDDAAQLGGADEGIENPRPRMMQQRRNQGDPQVFPQDRP